MLVSKRAEPVPMSRCVTHAHRREIVERLVHGLQRDGRHLTHHFGPDGLGRRMPTGRRRQRLEDALPLGRDLEALRSKVLDELAGRLHGRHPSPGPHQLTTIVTRKFLLVAGSGAEPLSGLFSAAMAELDP